MQQHTQCPAVVVHCMDFRLRNSLNNYLGTRFPRGYDLVSIAGGVKSLIADGEIDNFELEQLRLSDQLHQPEVMLFIQHEDCGAYGGSGAFQSPQAEVEFHRQELRRARELLASHFPSAQIETHFISLAGELVSL